MNRREFITTSSATAAFVLLAQNALSEEKQAAAPAPAAPASPHAGHAGHVGPAPVMPPLPKLNPYMNLIQASNHCLMVAQMTLQHCMMTLAIGDRSLVECAKILNDLGSVCSTLQHLAVANSPFTPAMAKVAMEVCLASEKECRKHEAVHQPCKACADACKLCAEECRKVAS